MKKPLFKTIALLSVAFAVSLTAQFSIKGAAEAADTQSGVETVENGIGEAKLKVRRCDLSAVVGERAFYLPEYQAISADGTDISELVTITDSLQSDIDFNNGTIILRETGEHVITYSVVDPATGETLKRSFTVTKYREIFDYYSLTGERNEKVAAEKQYCIALNPGQGISRFNMAASDMYYAEVYYNATEAMKFRAGLAHVVRTNFDKGTNSNLWFASMVDVENGMKHSVYKDTDWVFKAIEGTEKATELVAGEGFKYAVARNNTTLYAFINDELVIKYDCSELKGVLTAPGIFTVSDYNVTNPDGTKTLIKGDITAYGGVKISAINYLDGVKASSKIFQLTGERISTDVEMDISNAGWGAFDTPYIKG